MGFYDQRDPGETDDDYQARVVGLLGSLAAVMPGSGSPSAGC